MIKNNIVYDPITRWRFGISKAEGSFIWNESIIKESDK